MKNKEEIIKDNEEVIINDNNINEDNADVKQRENTKENEEIIEVNNNEVIEGQNESINENNEENKEENEEVITNDNNINKDNEDVKQRENTKKKEQIIDIDKEIEKAVEKKIKALEKDYKLKENNLILQNELKRVNLDEDFANSIKITAKDTEETIKAKVDAEVEKLQNIFMKWNKTSNFIPQTEITNETKEQTLDNKLLKLFN